MKKLTLMLGAGILLTLSVQAQNRNCGTMHYLEMQKQKDPSLEQRMKDNETKTQELIKKNSKQTDVKLPALPGFNPTGNKAVDEANYAKAKREYYEYTGFSKNMTQQDLKNDAGLREAKRKSNSIVQK